MGVREREFVEDAHKILEMMESLKNLKLDISLRKVEFFSPKVSSSEMVKFAIKVIKLPRKLGKVR